jgi:predicted MFS family arabinose efflux permease
MTAIRRLSGAAYGTHFADQIALVSLPLVAALAFDASPEVIGILAACQSSAHLLGSIPFGILVDQGQLRTLTILSALIAAVGFGMAALGIVLGSLLWFGGSVTVAGFGVVLFGLTSLSILPRVVGPDALAQANSAIQIPRALCSFAVPLAIGLIVVDVPPWSIFAAASLAAIVALAFSSNLPRFDLDPKATASIWSRIVEGGRYVAGHRLLLPITLCSVFWNSAFAALLVVLVPVLQDVYLFDPGAFGFALASFGLAAIVGSWLAGQLADRVAPRIILLFGPGSSAVAAFGLLLIDAETSEAWLYACFFLLGFGPSLWLVAQNAVRQLVSPPLILGRVNAVIQTAIYGVRPIGALIGGLVAGQAGPTAGLGLVAAAFGLSFAVSVFSDLRRISSYQSLRVTPAAE